MLIIVNHGSPDSAGTHRTFLQTNERKNEKVSPFPLNAEGFLFADFPEGFCHSSTSLGFCFESFSCAIAFD